MDLHRFYRCAMVFLDVLEELGRCAALDFVIWCFSHGYLFSHGIHGTHGNLSLRDGFLFEEGAVAPMGEWHHGVGGLGEVGDELLWVVE